MSPSQQGEGGEEGAERAAGTGLEGRPASRPERASLAASGRTWQGPAGDGRDGDSSGAAWERAPVPGGGHPVLWAHIPPALPSLQRAPPSWYPTVRSSLGRASLPPSLPPGQASEPGTQSLHVAAPSGPSSSQPPFPVPRSSETYGNSPARLPPTPGRRRGSARQTWEGWPLAAASSHTQGTPVVGLRC